MIGGRRLRRVLREFRRKCKAKYASLGRVVEGALVPISLILIDYCARLWMGRGV